MEYLWLETFCLHYEVCSTIMSIFNINKMSHRILSDLLILRHQISVFISK